MPDANQPIHILTLSGSLRAASSNSAALEAAASLSPSDVHLVRYDGLADLPHFNPDIETGPLPESVLRLRDEVRMCDGLIVSSPEYAHGIAGALKNALDWLVGSLDFPGKPVALINASPRACHAYSQLGEVLTTMSARLVVEACIVLPLTGRNLDAGGIARDPELVHRLRTCVARLSEAVRRMRFPEPGGG